MAWIKDIKRTSAAFVTISFLLSAGISVAHASESKTPKPDVEAVLESPTCVQVSEFVESRRFNVPKGSWFWREARNYLAMMGMPYDSYHLKKFEIAFKSIHSEFDERNVDHTVYYDLTSAFHQEGLADLIFDYCAGI
jgi:hypothetical protein